jgi:hypothetical protein
MAVKGIQADADERGVTAKRTPGALWWKRYILKHKKFDGPADMITLRQLEHACIYANHHPPLLGVAMTYMSQYSMCWLALHPTLPPSKDCIPKRIDFAWRLRSI